MILICYGLINFLILNWKYFLFKLIMDDIVIIGGGTSSLIGLPQLIFCLKKEEKLKL